MADKESKKGRRNSKLVSNGDEGKAARAAYCLLMRGGEVTAEDIFYEAFPEEDVCFNESPKVSTISKAINALKKEINATGNEIVEKKGVDPRKKIYQYKGAADPLGYVLRVYNSDFYEFLRTATPMLPKELFMYLLEETAVHEMLENEKKEPLIYSGNGFIMQHSELIADLLDKIKEKKPITFKYEPYNKRPFTVRISPHALKEYNERWLLFGKTKNKKTDKVQITQYALDRIAPETLANDRGPEAEFLEPESGYYSQYFGERIGVSTGEGPCDVVLRTRDANTHGRLVTKKLHDSQETIADFDPEKGYGEIRLHVVLNIELKAQILYQGKGVEVVSPASLREEVKDIVSEMAGIYGDSC